MLVTKAEGALDAVRLHPPQGVRQQGVPVAVPPVDGEGRTVTVELVAGGPRRAPGYWALMGLTPPEALVAGGDAPPRGIGEAKAVQHVVEERHHVRHAFRAAEGDDEEGVVAVRAVVEERCSTLMDPPPAATPVPATRPGRRRTARGSPGTGRSAPCPASPGRWRRGGRGSRRGAR